MPWEVSPKKDLKEQEHISVFRRKPGRITISHCIKWWFRRCGHMINTIVPIIFSAFIFTNGMRSSKSHVGSDGFFHFFTFGPHFHRTSPKFSICLRKKSKNEVDLSGKTKSSTVSKANKGRFRLQLLQLLLPTSRMTKKCYVLWTLVEKVFHCFGYMQRQRCSLTLCKAMYKTHGASTEYSSCLYTKSRLFCHTNLRKHEETKKTSPLRKRQLQFSWEDPTLPQKFTSKPWRISSMTLSSPSGIAPSMTPSHWQLWLHNEEKNLHGLTAPGNEVQGWCFFLRNFQPYYCNSSATKKNKNMG